MADRGGRGDRTRRGPPSASIEYAARACATRRSGRLLTRLRGLLRRLAVHEGLVPAASGAPALLLVFLRLRDGCLERGHEVHHRRLGLGLGCLDEILAALD